MPVRQASRTRLFEPAATLRQLWRGALSVAGNAGLVAAIDPNCRLTAPAVN
jgi:hypothetical protein